MTYYWMLSLPSWGDYHVSRTVNYVIPSVKAALKHSRSNVRFVVYTDQQKRIEEALDGFAVKFFPVPSRETVTGKSNKTRYVKLGDAERSALREAKRGECIGLLYGDTIVSREFFSSAERQFEDGSKLCMMQGPRVREYDITGIPIDAPAKTLLGWAWKYRHPWSDDCTWGGESSSSQPAVLYFKKNGSVVSRGFMLYSYAMIKDRELDFGTLTADHGNGISSAYNVNEIHIATSCDEVACASLTPTEHHRGKSAKLTIEGVVDWAKVRTVERNRWMFKHRCWMIGNGEADDGPVCDEILRRLK